MQIPQGNFGFRQADNAVQSRVRIEGADAVNEQLQRVGNMAMNVGQDMQRRQAAEDEAMMRIKASKTIAEHELAVATVDSDIEMKLRSGELSWDQAEKARNEAVSQLQVPDFADASPEIRAHVETSKMLIAGHGGLRIKTHIQNAKIQSMQSDVLLLMDAQGKKAGLPGADVEGINASIDAMDEDGRLAFGADWELKKQAFREGNFLNHVQQRIMEAGDNHAALKQLENELSAKDGYYADKIDASKRLSLQGNISNNLSRIEQRNEMLAMKREMRAQSVLGDIEKQNASGIPPTPEMLNNWIDMSKGTAAEGAVVGLIKQGEQVQSFLRQPIEAQQTIIQNLEANLKTNGGSPEDKSNLDRLKSVFEQNQKTLTENPLVYAKERLGDDIQPLDFSAAVTPGRENELFSSLRDRVSTVQAIQQKNGPQVKSNILLPQEADMLKAQLAQMNPQGQRQLLEGLRKASGDSKAYKSIMDQIAPDDPVVSYAGKVAAKQAEVVLDNGGFSFGGMEPATTAKGADVADMLLSGNKILKEKSIQMPKESAFTEAMQQYSGGAFANAPQAQAAALANVRAYYAAKAAKDGYISDEPKQEYIKEAFNAAVGEPIEHNGKTVLAPWGMDADSFLSKAETIYQTQGLSVDFDDVTLLPAGDGRYAVTSGRSALLKNGKPVYIEVR